MTTHSSTLAYKIPWMEEPGGLQSMGSPRVGHDWANHRRRRQAGALSVAESYPTSEVRDSSPECQAATAQERPGGATPHPRSGAGGREELPSIPGQWWPGGDTPHLRSGQWPGGATQRLRSGAAGRSHLAPEARGSHPEEPPRAQDQGQQLGGATHI